jgi:hypothetical protein
MYPAFSANPASGNNGGRSQLTSDWHFLSRTPWSPKLQGDHWTSGNGDSFTGTTVIGDGTDSCWGPPHAELRRQRLKAYVFQKIIPPKGPKPSSFGPFLCLAIWDRRSRGLLQPRLTSITAPLRRRLQQPHRA